MLNDRGALVETIELDEGGELSDWREADLVVAMGGPMSVRDEIEHPWLAGEKRWIAAAVRVDVPYFGVCLGAQLLAASSDAPIHTALPVSRSWPPGSSPRGLPWHGPRR